MSKLSKILSLLLQDLKKEVSDEVDILHAHKYEIFLQIDTMMFDGEWSSILKVPILKNPKNEVSAEVHFLHADKHQSFL